MRAVEQGAADEDEEEQPHERAAPQRGERVERRGVRRPESKGAGEEEKEQRDGEEECGDEAAQGEEAPEQRFEQDFRLAGLRARVDRLPTGVPEPRLVRRLEFLRRLDPPEDQVDDGAGDAEPE